MNALTKDLMKLTAIAEKDGNKKECYRQRLHLMPPVGWLNDPNGLCQFRGVYHAYLSGRYDAAHQRSESMERKRKIFYGSWRTQKRLGFQGKPKR